MSTKSKAVNLKVVGQGQATSEINVVSNMKKKDLIDEVVAISGAKPRDVKPIVEATLKALAAGLSGNDQIQIPPLGKIKVVKSKDVGGATSYTVKIRVPDAPEEPKIAAPLSEPNDAG